MKRASIQLRLAAFLCLFGILFAIIRIILTQSYSEAKEALKRFLLENPEGYVGLPLIVLVVIPVSLYVLLTGRHPSWAYRLFGGAESKFAANRRELILKLILLMVLAILIALFVLEIRRSWTW